MLRSLWLVAACRLRRRAERGGGSDTPEPDAGAEGAIFVVEGELVLTLAGDRNVMAAGGFAYIPPATEFSIRNEGSAAVRFHWIRKAYEPVAFHRCHAIVAFSSDWASPEKNLDEM